jgi:hypothetical protein
MNDDELARGTLGRIHLRLGARLSPVDCFGATAG